MTTEKIMDVVEETVETMAEPVAEVAKEIDWSKYGLVGVGIGVGVGGTLAMCKLVPKAIGWGKNMITKHNVRKMEKQDGDYIEVKKCEVNDVEEKDEN